MELARDYRIWIFADREAELALAAERARVAAERAASSSKRSQRGRSAGGGLLSRLRRRGALAARPVAR